MKNDKPFLNDDDFEKSTGIDDSGTLFKAIPSVKKVTSKVEVDKKALPKEFYKFKKNIEMYCEEIDKVITELMEKYKSHPEKMANLIKHWADFKSSFQNKLNDCILYPEDPEIEKAPGNDKNRIDISKGHYAHD